MDKFIERLNAHGSGGYQSICGKNCGLCCKDCSRHSRTGCVLPVEERPAVCNRYLCPDQIVIVPGEPSSTVPPFEPAPYKIEVRAAMARWEKHRVRDVPAGCPPHSTFGSAYLTNVRDWGTSSVWDYGDCLRDERVLIIGGGPSAKSNMSSALVDGSFSPGVVLFTRDWIKKHYSIWTNDSRDVFVVDGEIDMLGHVRDYPSTYSSGLICDPCKILDPQMKFDYVYFCRLPPMMREDTFVKPQWLGRELPYRTSGELALYIALYILNAPVVGVLGIENEGPDRHIIYENAMNLLTGGHSSEVIDFSGRGVVKDFLDGKL